MAGLTSSLRVAFDARSLISPVLRGMDRYTVGLVRELVREGARVTLFHRAREPLHAAHVADLGCEVQALNDRSGIHWEQVAVPLALWRGRFDVFHAPAERGVPWLAPCPTVLTIHSATSHSYVRLVRQGLLPDPVRKYLGCDFKPHDRRFPAWYHRTGIMRASHIVTPSRFARAEVIDYMGIPASRVTTTHLAVGDQFLKPPKPELARLETLRSLGVRQPYLLYVGGFEPHKNVPGLLEVFAAVRRKLPDLSLVAVGSKSLPDSLREKAAQLQLEPGRDVKFLLNLSEELNDLYDSACLFVTLSWRETFCLPALEAMTRGLVPVASAWGASPEVIGDAGRLIDPRDHEEAKGAILETLTADDQTQLAQRAREQAERFKWRDTARQTLGIYNRLVNGPAGGGNA